MREMSSKREYASENAKFLAYFSQAQNHTTHAHTRREIRRLLLENSPKAVLLIDIRLAEWRAYACLSATAQLSATTTTTAAAAWRISQTERRAQTRQTNESTFPQCDEAASRTADTATGWHCSHSTTNGWLVAGLGTERVRSRSRRRVLVCRGGAALRLSAYYADAACRIVCVISDGIVTYVWHQRANWWFCATVPPNPSSHLRFDRW